MRFKFHRAVEKCPLILMQTLYLVHFVGGWKIPTLKSASHLWRYKPQWTHLPGKASAGHVVIAELVKSDPAAGYADALLANIYFCCFHVYCPTRVKNS